MVRVRVRVRARVRVRIPHDICRQVELHPVSRVAIVSRIVGGGGTEGHRRIAAGGIA